MPTNEVAATKADHRCPWIVGSSKWWVVHEAGRIGSERNLL